jgi:hypothetical protein
MKKLLIIAAASCFTFISCSKVEPTPESQRDATPASERTAVSQSKLNPNPPAPLDAQVFVITNIETNWGVVEYRLEYTDVNAVVHNVPLQMGQSITLCLNGVTSISTNFAHTITAIGNC